MVRMTWFDSPIGKRTQEAPKENFSPLSLDVGQAKREVRHAHKHRSTQKIRINPTHSTSTKQIEIRSQWARSQSHCCRQGRHDQSWPQNQKRSQVPPRCHGRCLYGKIRRTLQNSLRYQGKVLGSQDWWEGSPVQTLQGHQESYGIQQNSLHCYPRWQNHQISPSRDKEIRHYQGKYSKPI